MYPSFHSMPLGELEVRHADVRCRCGLDVLQKKRFIMSLLSVIGQGIEVAALFGDIICCCVVLFTLVKNVEHVRIN